MFHEINQFVLEISSEYESLNKFKKKLIPHETPTTRVYGIRNYNYTKNERAIYSNFKLIN